MNNTRQHELSFNGSEVSNNLNLYIVIVKAN